MQEKYSDTREELIEDLFADDTNEEHVGAPIPAVKIVHFDSSDRPADSETRPLRSFL
ncbi:MAG: hypothetical protein ACPH8C_05450 [Candidatus Puniceispirillaceae bacterium]|jgi:hypothetical protein